MCVCIDTMIRQEPCPDAEAHIYANIVFSFWLHILQGRTAAAASASSTSLACLAVCVCECVLSEVEKFDKWG